MATFIKIKFRDRKTNWAKGAAFKYTRECVDLSRQITRHANESEMNGLHEIETSSFLFSDFNAAGGFEGKHSGWFSVFG